MALEFAHQLQPLPPQLLWFCLQLKAQELQQAWAGVLQIKDRRLEQGGRTCGAGRTSTSWAGQCQWASGLGKTGESF